MSKLREKLKERAEIELRGIVSDAGSALDGLHPAVTAEDVATLVIGGRTATLEKKVILRMATAMENELVEQFNSQDDLPLGKKETL